MEKAILFDETENITYQSMYRYCKLYKTIPATKAILSVLSIDWCKKFIDFADDKLHATIFISKLYGNAYKLFKHMDSVLDEKLELEECDIDYVVKHENRTDDEIKKSLRKEILIRWTYEMLKYNKCKRRYIDLL